MIAVLLSVIAIIAIIAMFMGQTRASGVSRHATEAAMLASDKLEQLRTLAPTANSETGIDPRGRSGGIFTRAWTVTIGATYTDLVVRVGWNEGDAVMPSCSLHSACTSGFCDNGYCAGHAIVVRGRRNN
jgi:hypothetical protein